MRHALLLPARELVATLPDDGVVALGQLQDPLVDRRRPAAASTSSIVAPGFAYRGCRALSCGTGRSPGSPRPCSRPSDSSWISPDVDPVDRAPLRSRRRRGADEVGRRRLGRRRRDRPGQRAARRRASKVTSARPNGSHGAAERRGRRPPPRPASARAASCSRARRVVEADAAKRTARRPSGGVEGDRIRRHRRSRATSRGTRRSGRRGRARPGSRSVDVAASGRAGRRGGSGAW